MELLLYGLAGIGTGVAIILTIAAIWYFADFVANRKEFKAKQLPGPSQADQFSIILDRSIKIHSDVCNMREKLFSIESEVSQNSDDLEAIRRKLHELAGDVKSIKSVFAVVPVAEVVND